MLGRPVDDGLQYSLSDVFRNAAEDHGRDCDNKVEFQILLPAIVEIATFVMEQTDGLLLLFVMEREGHPFLEIKAHDFMPFLFELGDFVFCLL